MMVLIATDLPGPGRPGDQEMRHLREVGDDRLPSRSRPRVTGREARLISHSGASSSSRSVTMRAVGLGISTPTAPLPGIGATRIDWARMAIAISSASEAIRPALIPGAGTTSN